MNLYQDDQLYKRLKDLDVIPIKKLEGAYETSQKENISLAVQLLDKELISEKNLGRTIADLLDIPFASFDQVGIEKDIVKTIPKIVAEKQKIIAFKKDKQGLHLAMRNPKDLEIIEFVKKKSGDPVIVYYLTESDYKDGLSVYLEDAEELFEDIINKNIKKAKQSTNVKPPIKKLVNTVIDYAHKNKASDIHLEPMEDKFIVRFRVDGKLHDVTELPLDLHNRMVTRIKVLARLRTDEHREPQDGKFGYKLEEGNNQELDLRVSIVPVTEGEKVVLRLLSEASRRLTLSELGLSEQDLEKVTKSYQSPYGMILATGPTGCGKTTTMYAILKKLNDKDVNVMTIEDPVEYNIERVNQIQVNKETDLSFANGLRSIVRQDPDIILVGEIRDVETADIAVNSAMTGHSVLSTLHTNNAATTMPRLIDMEVEPFLVASSINVVIAQRLVRKICNKCRRSKVMEKSEIEKISPRLLDKYFKDKEKIRVYQGEGCPSCHQTGYSGRVGIFEVMELDDELQDAIVAKKDAEEIEDLAKQKGMTTMIEDGIRKVKEGITTIEEIVRVTKE